MPEKTHEETKEDLAAFGVGVRIDFGNGEFVPPLPKYMLNGVRFADVCRDALSYIQQLEEDNAELLTKVEQLEAKCHQLERERDAAVEDIEVDGVCGTCKYLDFYEEKCPCDQCVHIGRGLNSHWQWRGVKENKPNGEDNE